MKPSILAAALALTCATASGAAPTVFGVGLP